MRIRGQLGTNDMYPVGSVVGTHSRCFAARPGTLSQDPDLGKRAAGWDFLTTILGSADVTAALVACSSRLMPRLAM